MRPDVSLHTYHSSITEPNAGNATVSQNVPTAVNHDDHPELAESGGTDKNQPKRIRRQEWDKHRKTIHERYPLMTLPELKDFMEHEHNFSASTQQWKKKLAEWRLSKNLTKRMTQFIRKKGRERLLANKKTAFRLGGQEVPIDKIKRHIQTERAHNGTLVPDDAPKSTSTSAPTGLSYYTQQTNRSESDPVSISRAGSPAGLPVDSPAADTPGISDTPQGSLRMAFWSGNGKDLDGLLADSQLAIDLTKKGDYKAAKPLFLESIDGLTFLLSPCHHETLRVLEEFVKAAMSNRDDHSATERMHKSYQEHKQKFGMEHPKTWQSLAHLGKLYRRQTLTGQASHMLFNARNGLLEATSANPEYSFNATHWISSELVEIELEIGNLEGAEEESLRHIRLAESLGAAYEREAALLKHNLAHLYHRADMKDVEHAPLHSRRARIEDLLLDLISSNKRKVIGFEKAYLCSWEQLRYLYTSTGQISKLESFLIRIEDFLETFNPRDSGVLGKWMELTKGIVDSYTLLEQPEKASEWLQRRQDHIERSAFYGAQSAAALSNMMHFASAYLQNKERDKAISWLEKAQSLAKDILHPEHTFHSHVSRAISDGVLDGSLCLICLVNPGSERSARRPGEALEDLFERWLHERGHARTIDAEAQTRVDRPRDSQLEVPVYTIDDD
ncbi:hypothetical protein PFICI_02304 [Pestalotiopsis fici W106-1]|uniref:Clr5 domain-containing protein n=1 Tax=Pestalotiopsis fici (strain W106-1 / CGMCC3.15140) TaxID=1229662 RepID=W3XE46_PESFW|nr:uncharacterized protein PFICI_02304 [Pestalotiopsis fici W106-1]ETS84279.1 hypothetical protein PFICI_02304 [Pestalotiopsis fici W106-1]